MPTRRPDQPLSPLVLYSTPPGLARLVKTCLSITPDVTQKHSVIVSIINKCYIKPSTPCKMLLHYYRSHLSNSGISNIVHCRFMKHCSNLYEWINIFQYVAFLRLIFSYNLDRNFNYKFYPGLLKVDLAYNPHLYMPLPKPLLWIFFSTKHKIFPFKPLGSVYFRWRTLFKKRS